MTDTGMNVDAFEARLSTIESEVRRIADSLTLLIRLDERMVTLFKAQEELKGRVGALEVSESRTGFTVGAWQKFGWIVVAALAAFGLNIGRDIASHQPVTAPTVIQQKATDQPRNEGP